jgi:hypothetical protein
MLGTSEREARGIKVGFSGFFITMPSAICPPGLNVKSGRRNQVDFDIVNWRPNSKLGIMVQDKMYVLGRPRDT